MMQVLFTTTDGWSSRTIRKLTGEEVSHCAIRISDFVIHSDWAGVEIMTYQKFAESRQIVYSVPLRQNVNKLMKMLSEAEGSWYDYGAILYMGARILAKKIGINLPKINIWQTTGMFLCTEFVTKLIDKSEDSMITPGQLYTKLTSGEK
jgi:hypothetical protein